MHSFSFAFAALFAGGLGGGGGGLGGGLATGLGGALTGGGALATGLGGALGGGLATGLGGGGGGLATGFFWMIFFTGPFLAGAAFFLAAAVFAELMSSLTFAEGIVLRPAPFPRSDSAEGGGAGMKRTFFFSFREGDLAFVIVFFGGTAFFGFGNVVFKAKMGAGEDGLAGALAATFFAGAATFFAGAATFFAGAAFFAGALLTGFAFAAGLPMVILLKNSIFATECCRPPAA